LPFSLWDSGVGSKIRKPRLFGRLPFSLWDSDSFMADPGKVAVHASQLPFSLWDSEADYEGLQDSFAEVQSCRSPYEIQNTLPPTEELEKLITLPFSLWDSQPEEQSDINITANYLSLTVAVLLMRFSYGKQPWNSQVEEVAVLLMRFWGRKRKRSNVHVHLVAVLLMRFWTTTAR